MADGAVGPVGPHQVLGLDDRPVSALHVNGHGPNRQGARLVRRILLEGFEPPTFPQVDAEVVDCVPSEYGFEVELREVVLGLGCRPVRGDVVLPAFTNLGRRRAVVPGELGAGLSVVREPGDVHDVGVVVRR